MKQRSQVIEELVLEAVANDYENFAFILHDVCMRAVEYGAGAVSHAEILAAIEEIIREGYAKAYTLSAGPPAKAEQTNYSAEAIDDLWFYVTPSGKALVKALEDSEEDEPDDVNHCS